MELTGLHHVTAVTGRAAQNVQFYTQTLGMRLVKKTVNQDDVSAYHLFYGDQVGQAGTEVTFFEWPDVGPNVAGAGSLTTIGLRVNGRAALDWWAQRLDQFGVAREEIVEREGRAALAFTDPEGQRLVLADDGGASGGTPWVDGPVPPEHGIRGLDSITMIVRQLGPTAQALTEALGFRQVGERAVAGNGTGHVAVFQTGAGGPGTLVHVEVRPQGMPARVGIGGIHHVAFRTPDDAEHQKWQQHLTRLGLNPTPVIDRFYFRSIYFRVPGGALFEIATDGPGFATDEDPAHLGEQLALPPFLEPYREKIAAGLKPV